MRKKESSSINTEIILGTIAIVLFVISVTLTLSIFHKGGAGSDSLLVGLKNTLGFFAYFTPLVLIYTSIILWRGKTPALRASTAIGMLISTVSLFGLLGTFSADISGTLGQMISAPLSVLIGPWPTFVSLLALTYLGAMISTGRKTLIDMESAAEHTVFKIVKYPFLLMSQITNIFNFDGIDLGKKRKSDIKTDDEEEEEILEESTEEELVEEELSGEEYVRERMLGKSPVKPSKPVRRVETEEEYDEDDESEDDTAETYSEIEFIPPPVSLLNVDQGRSNGGDTKSKGKQIQSTLAEFGVPVEITGVTVGPTVTQFRVKTPQGFKVRDIMKYHENLQMNLAADSIHIDAPIPGQSVVGIDIPNKEKQKLGLGSLIDTDAFRDSNNLTVVIGKDIVGKPVYGDIESMPHLLIAGATKSGKSVTIQNIITSLLYKNAPEDMKLIIIDPKKVEFTLYKGLPHLWHPVITDVGNTLKCLGRIVAEMERRYDYFADNYEGIQNVSDYNKKVYYPALEKERKKKNPNYNSLPEKFPYIVIVFDEFNDFMVKYGKDITNVITSLSQKARAAGIHLILATQRPDVKVINGTIKANIPGRIALRTSSRVDSQTIIGEIGAEDLLGNGDMLFQNPGDKLVRVQAPYVSSDEVKNVLRYIKDRYNGYEAPQLDLTKNPQGVTGGDVTLGGSDYSTDVGDPEDEALYENIKNYVISTGRISATNIQTKFKLGFSRASRMVMMLEERGVITAPDSSKKRQVIGAENQNGGTVDGLEDIL